MIVDQFNSLWSFLVNQLQSSSFIQVISSPSTTILANAPSTTSTSTIYVQHTSRIHASCPAGFGPHFDNPDGRLMQLLPIESITHPNKTNDSNLQLQNHHLIEARRGCPPTDLLSFLSHHLDLTIDHSQLSSYSHSTVLEPPKDWIALVERGTCTFVDKIRYAQYLGASAVIVGDWDQSPTLFKTESGPIFYSNPLGSDKFGFGTGLVTMYAPGDTSDLEIPSVFVARDSYMSLREDWLELNSLQSPVSSNLIHGQSVDAHLPQALEVIMSKDQLWTWPFFDLLIILLFLPSILTAVTLVLHRINLFRKRRADRAPQAFVDRLPCVIWAKDMEKGIPAGSELSDCPEESVSRPKNSVLGLGWITHTCKMISSWPILQRHRSSNDSEHTPLLDPSRPHLKTNRSLPIPKVYFAQRECALCLSDFEIGDLVRILPCGHCFHQAEITNNCMGIDCWLLKSKRLCPICRMSIMEQENEEAVKPSNTPIPGPMPISASDIAGSSSSPIPIRSTPQVRSPIPSSSSVTLDQARLPSRR